jgi:molybdopterin molybdotransferase
MKPANKYSDAIPRLDLERVAILDALGRVIGEDVFAPRSCRLSTIRHGRLRRSIRDTAGAAPDRPAILDVVEDIPAGVLPRRPSGQVRPRGS